MPSFDLSALRQALPPGLLLEVAPVVDRMADLLPEERALVESAVESRRHEFSSARCLARSLLADLGVSSQPLLPDANRSPIWPQGVLGSLSHSRRYCAVAVARTVVGQTPCETAARPTTQNSALLGIGVDLEDVRPLRRPLFEELLTQQEIQRLDSITTVEQQAQRVLAAFSIKEALYKAMSPIDNAGLGFHDVEIFFPAGPGEIEIVGLPGLLRRLPPNCSLFAFQITQSPSLLSIVSILQMENGPN